MHGQPLTGRNPYFAAARRARTRNIIFNVDQLYTANTHNNLIRKPAAIRAGRKYYSSFECARRVRSTFLVPSAKTPFALLDVILRPVCTHRAAQVVLLSRTTATALRDFFSPRSLPSNAKRYTSFGIVASDLRSHRIGHYRSRVSAKVIRVGRSCETTPGAVLSILFISECIE